MSQSLIIQAMTLAQQAHAQQVRKYTNEPYISHPFAVAGLVMSTTDDAATISAAFLHDVVEDTDIPLEQIRDEFGETVAFYVEMLTDVDRSFGNRATRKEHDRQRLASAPRPVKTIKLADLIDNTKTIVALDPHFSKVYMREKTALLPALQGGDATLMDLALAIQENYFATMEGVSA